jgi:hypothetical protein
MPVRRRYVFQLALLIFSPDLAERYLIAQHELNYNGCVTAAAKYSYRGYRLDKAILFPALHRVVEAHGALGVRLVGASTNYPAFPHHSVRIYVRYVDNTMTLYRLRRRNGRPPDYI